MPSQSKHPPAPIWTPQNHFGFCGPHCFCCRALAGYTHSVCSVCISNLKNKLIKNNNNNEKNDNKLNNYKLNNNKKNTELKKI